MDFIIDHMHARWQVTGEIGDNARDLLKGAGSLLLMYNGPSMVKDAIDAILKSPVE